MVGRYPIALATMLEVEEAPEKRFFLHLLIWSRTRERLCVEIRLNVPSFSVDLGRNWEPKFPLVIFSETPSCSAPADRRGPSELKFTRQPPEAGKKEAASFSPEGRLRSPDADLTVHSGPQGGVAHPAPHSPCWLIIYPSTGALLNS